MVEGKVCLWKDMVEGVCLKDMVEGKVWLKERCG